MDNSAESVKIIRDNLAHTKLEDRATVAHMPNSAFLKSTKETFDIAVLDPPYNHKLIQKSMPQLVEKMSDYCIIICEHERDTTLPESYGDFSVSKIHRHGKTTLTVYRREAKDIEE